MVERVSSPSGRPLAIAFTLTAMALDLELPVTAEAEVWWGVIEPGSMELGEDGHHFRFARSPQLIVYPGSIPDDVCPGEDAVVEGKVEGGRFVATSVRRMACIKGNECRPYACLPVDQRPAWCRGQLRFE